MNVMLAPVSNVPVPYGRAVMKRHNLGIVLLTTIYAMQCPEIEARSTSPLTPPSPISIYLAFTY